MKPLTDEERTIATEQRVNRIRELNDHARKHLGYSQVVLTRGISDKEPEAIDKILKTVSNYNLFSEDNDPYGEHDFGSFIINGETMYFKFDYYNEDMTQGSQDATDETKTTRVLTIMLASEY
jgi:hypothetical protein